MRELPAQEHDQPSVLRQQIFEFRVFVVQVQTQFPAVLRLPVFVQIEYARQFPAAVAAKLVDMPGVESTCGVAGEMAFEFEQPELQSPVQCKPQLFESAQARALRFT